MQIKTEIRLHEQPNHISSYWKAVIGIPPSQDAIEEWLKANCGDGALRIVPPVTVWCTAILRASNIYLEPLKNSSVEFIWNSQVKEILHDKKVTGVVVENLEGQRSEISCPVCLQSVTWGKKTCGRSWRQPQTARLHPTLLRNTWYKKTVQKHSIGMRHDTYRVFLACAVLSA